MSPPVPGEATPSRSPESGVPTTRRSSVHVRRHQHPRPRRERCRPVRRGLHPPRRRLQRHEHGVGGIRSPQVSRGRPHRRDRGRHRGEPLRGGQAGDPEGDRPQHEVRTQVGCRRWHRARRDLPALDPRQRRGGRFRRGPGRQASSATPPRRAGAAARERHPARALRSGRPGLRPQRRQDPQGTRAGRRHRRCPRSRRSRPTTSRQPPRRRNARTTPEGRGLDAERARRRSRPDGPCGLRVRAEAASGRLLASGGYGGGELGPRSRLVR